jgi:hypothetical protein
VVIHGDAEEARPHGDPKATQSLLRVLPAAARVLQVGCSHTTLARDHKRLHPGSIWYGLDDRADVLERCAAGLDHSMRVPLDQQPLLIMREPFDLVVLDDTLHRCRDPLRLLRQLAALCRPDAALVLESSNFAQIEMLARLVEADLTGADSGPSAQRRPHSPASVFKLLLDAGWMPALADASSVSPGNEPLLGAALALADALGVPRSTASQTLHTDRFVVEARRCFGPAPAASGAARFGVIVPTTRESQLRLNVERSPGLREVGARIVSYRRARSPAEALEQAAQHVDSDWIVLCHQDVYFPAGFGHRLNALLGAIPAGERDRTLIGFAGMAVNTQADGYAPAGFVIDRFTRFDHPASEHAVSIDELAIVLSPRSIHRIDARCGWHLWATELCLASICEHKVFPHIIRLPLFHNSLNDQKLAPSFFESAAYLRAKYPDFGTIATLHGTIGADFGRTAGSRRA